MDQSHNYIAHMNEFSKKTQTVKEHCESTAKLSASYAIEALKDLAYATGLLHDVGKFQSSFQRRIHGENIRVEHSTCGALAAREIYPMPLCLMMEYCIAGHHGGIPDGGTPDCDETMSTLYGRMRRNFEDFSEYQKELCPPGLQMQELVRFITKDCGRDTDRLIDIFSFFVRYLFSCLVDADSKDTAEFCKEGELPGQLGGDFENCLHKVNRRLTSFHHNTVLQKTRASIQEQAFRNAKRQVEIYLLNMPTGSGKTLASVKIALEKAISGKKKRIIYVIPYNSIIEQTADEFEKLFGSDMEILRHQSTFSYEEKENGSEDYRQAAKLAIENWDAPFIITTAVQFFESIYSNKRGKLRKMHNMADSILIFDEAHLMPQDYLQPCLQGIAYITRYLNSEAIFLTATMPDFRALLTRYALPDTVVLDLIEDTSEFAAFQKCRYFYLGEQKIEDLLKKSRTSPSSLFIVNTKKKARELYEACGYGKKYHLSTYMTPYDRKRVLKDIKIELDRLEEDYPGLENVPEERRITIISTSLIEAGVDLDVFMAFREMAGLDHILQAGGRCNREGKREKADVFIFEFEENTRRVSADSQANLARGQIRKYQNISEEECIKEYYSRIFSMENERIQKNTMHQYCTNLASIPFKTYADQFEIIDTRTLSLVVARDERSKTLVDLLKYKQSVNIRQLQNYACTLQKWELDDLLRQHAADDYGTGIYCLTNPDYYDDDLGITFEAKDYFI